PEVRSAIDFADDDDSVFEGDIEWLYSRGITQGTSATTFSPNNPVTRGQMAAFLHRALGD
ncbi:MAG: S-layer homology domain-containing protein, partial [Acidimicrobiia bacterium]|nr:S-layer homology domain-containing protein [Acidimicrobiia bacterium]